MVLDTAVVGAGVVSDTHLSGVAKNPRTELVAICDLDESRVKTAASEYGITPYQDVDELLTRESLDWLHVCTPVQTHLEICKKAIEAGVPVLVEKPVTETVAELEELQRLAESEDVPVSPVHQHLFDPAMRRARELIDSGALGEIRGVDLVFAGHSRPGEANRGSWVFDLPGGEFEEGLPHPIYLGLAAAGYPDDREEISVSTTLFDDSDGEFAYDSVQVQYTTPNNTLCSMTMLSGGTLKREIHIHGSEKSIAVDVILQNVRAVEGDYKSSAVAKAIQSLDYSFQHVAGLAGNVKLFASSKLNDDWESAQRVNSHYAQFDQTARAIERGKEMPVPLESAKWTIETMERIREAAAEDQKPVPTI